MGFGRGMRVPLWALAFMICSIQQKASSAEGESGKVTIIPPLTTTPVITSFNSAHNGQVCSTWGQFHYKTFDGDIYYFPGTCNYVFASHCNAAYEDFNIQIRRTMVKDIPTISSVTMRLDGTDFEMQKDAIVVNGDRVQLPYTGSGFVIEKFTIYVRVIVKLGLTLLWNEKDSLMLELDKKYANQTCGLCGDFNGIPQYNEFYSNGAEITTLQFGNMQKMNGPTEECEDPTPVSLSNCTDEFELCQHVLTGSSFFQCNAVVGVNDYIEACVQDLCLCKQEDITSCLCDTFAEYSRQCAHAGGEPQNWRSPDLCPMECSSNMQYQECESPCTDTCSNSERSQLCEDHCVDGCFCPPGTVYDDIDNAGCIPHEQCSCVYNGKSYAPGTTYSDNCRSCSCVGGQWNCIELPCPGICSVEGGSHISTFDKKRYNVHGDCVYVLSKFCGDDTFSVLGELRKCGLTETETCLKMVALNINGDQTTIVISPNGGVLVNSLYTQLPLSAANVTMFRPSSFFIIVHTNFGLQLVIQLVPTMQLYIHVDPSFKGRTCGLCGNFDKRQMDDFTAISGVVEGTASAFANTWKTQAACPNIKQSFEDPCTLSIENEKYARHWCGLLTDSEGPFAKCHASVNPASYHTNCMFDTCNCERSEDCMCAALSSYVRACAAEKVELPGWRTNVCSRYTTSCPKSLNYSYSISSCQPTCRSLSEPDVTCNVKFVPVDGCTCESGTYMDDYGKCVPANKCPCYYKGTSILSGEVLHDVGVLCTCSQGKLNCIGDGDTKQVCVAPMVYFNCRNATAGQTGAECQKSCQTLDMHCYSTQCVSGCMCPAGLVSDGKGGCIAMEECPCIHNDATYQPGEKIKVNCNTCVCKNRMWECTKDRCLGTCAVYGDGHYITFDDKRYIFNGKCEYTLVQDHCGQNNSAPGTFRVITENVPCGTTGTTCSKSIKVFFGNYDLILSEERHELIQRGDEGQVPYKIRYMGMYLVIEANNGLILLWDKKTSVFIKLRDDFKGQVCGLCGNYDGNGMNDFTTRSQSVVSDVLEFGNSWKVSPTCPEAKCTKDPCFKNPYRKSWAQKQCSIINSKAFAACHSQVEPTRYYEACVTDSCACDTGGDCECFCTAVAAYAQACSEFGVCISWRTPSFCPMFCDYYNDERECEWHYKPCGAPCMKTCRNPSGRCHYQLPGLEGCYPHCPADRPYFNEDEMTCVDVCGCYDDQGNYHPLGKTFDSRKTCQACTCTSKGIECNYDAKACYCYYEGKTYIYKDVIYNTTDGLGWCMIATCDVNGTIHRELFRCGGTTTIPPTVSTATPKSTTPQTTVCVHRTCEWTEWYDVSYPKFGRDNGDYETPEKIRDRGNKVCKMPDEVECRAQRFPNESIETLGQNVQCSKSNGLICNNKDQTPPICLNFEIRFLCCLYTPCGASTTPATPEITTAGSRTTSKVTGGITTTLTPLLTTTAGSITTGCQPKCQWTPWFSFHTPSSDPGDGDREDIKSIQASGGTICEHPQKVECRGVDYKELSASELGQNMICDINTGLLCENAKQKGKYKICYDYEMRALCCDYKHCETTPAPLVTTSATTTEAPGSTVGKSTAPASSTGSTPPPVVPTTTESTTLVSTTPGETTGKPTTTETPGSTAGKSTAPASSTGSTPPPVVFTTTESTPLVPTTPGVTTRKPTTTTHSTPLSTLPLTTPGSVSTAAVSTGVVPTVTATTLQSTPVSKPSSTIPTTGTTAQTPPGLLTTTTTLAPLVTTTPGSTTTGCQPKCQWTSWFSFHTPSSDPGDGDREDIKSIQASGGTICDHPQKVECRGVDYKELSASELGQNMICDINTGLLCENAKQKGKYKICYDYEMRALCCDYKHCETTPAPLVTTSATTTEAPGSTVGKSTAPASSTGSTPPPVVPTTTESTTLVSTTPGETTGKPTTTETPGSTAGKSTAPASSTGSTPPPVVFTTTESTTLVPTTPGVTTRKPTTTTHSTPLSTLPLTTPGSVSTAAVSTGVVPTVTATTLQSTPVSKPSSTIPTTGTTAQTPPGLLTTTTTLAPLVTTTPGSTTTGCQPKCQWTSWFSFHTPSSDPGDGDREDIKSIQASGGTICDHPQKVECRGVDYKELSASELGQNMICDINTGLLCENAKQKGKYKICYDYEMRALCCDYKHCETTPAPLVTTSATTTEAPGSTVGKSTAPASSTGSTPPPVVPTTTESTTLVSTTPGETTGKPTTTETPGSTAGKSTAPASSTGSTPPPVVFTTTESTTLVPTTPGVTTRKPTTTTHSTPLSTLPLTTPGSVSTAAVSTGVVPTVTATTLQSTPVSKPSSTIPTTGTTAQTPPGLLTTTTTLAPLVTTTPGSTTTGCQPKCQWTSWFSFHTPSSDPGDGDREDIKSIQASGGTICDHPQKVECRGVDYKELSASELGQNMICDINTGLLCENAKQKGKYKICYDYEMRALCCDYKHCETTPAPLVTTSATTTEAPGSTVGKSTAPASSTGSTPPPVVPTTTESTTLVSTTPGETTGKPTTTETPGSTAGKSTAPASSTGSTPPPVVFTTTESTTLVPTTPGVTTRKPTTTTHSTPLSTLPLTTPGSVSTAAVSTGVVPTVTATTLQSTPVSKPSSTIPTTGTTAQTPPGLLTTTTTLAPLVTTTPGSTTTGCQPKCQWTSWFSFHTPSSDPGDGDREDIKSIQASGGTICDHPQKVECRGVDYKELSASELGQNMICDINTGLLCENAKQKGKYKICYDYEMRALCCDYKHCETTPAPLVTTSATTTEAPGSTVGKSTAPASSTGSTPPPVVPTTTESTTLVSTTPGETTGKPTTTETPGSTAGKSTAPASSTGSTPPPVVFTTTESTTLVPTTPGVTTRKPTTTTHSTPLSTLPLTTPGSVSTAAVSTGVVPTVTATTLQSTPVSKPSSTIPTTGTTAQTPPGLLTTTTTLAPLVTTTPGSTTTGCQPKCQWTSWFSFHTPSSDPGDGDREDIKSIQASGGTICDHPQKVECRGVDYKELSASELGQNMICDINTGLLCENAKQKGKYKICYDYEMRALCCDYKHCETTPAPLVTTSATTTEAPGSTAGKSTAPASSTGSTPPPVVFTTTESTTLVPTTPGVTTRKPTTTSHSTPLSTLPLTTPGSVSTAAVSTGVVPTVTATTLQSTPVSKPSSTIPTTGTTAQTPPGLLTTTTTLAPLLTTTPGSTTTGCQPKCQWTSWFSFHTPSSNPGDGDREDIKSIQASGGTICDHPQKVECRGVDYKELSASELGQNMICDINTGLLCENAKQKGKYKICYDYEMRALCCDYKHCETTPAPLVTTSATTTEAPGSTVGKSTAPASSTGSTPPPVVPTTTESTTLVSTTPGETTGKPTTTETPGSTAGKSTAPASSTGSTPPPVVFTTTESTTLVPTTPGVTTRKPTTTTHSTPLSTLPLTTPGSVSTAAVSTGVVPTVTATTLQSTPVSKPSSTIPTTGTTAQTPPGLLTTTTTLAPLVTTTPGSTTTGCQPKCQWTSWFSFHTPSSDPGDGDREDIKSIQASGGTICDHPQKVECRGVDYKELSASELGQNMICDINTGLLCENAKQKGKYKICYDYEMRALCCDYKHCETTPAPLVTTSATTTEAPGSTVGKSTAPASSTGSTPPPVVPTTTESTTLVSTTPGETTGKPTTTETPGSTAGKSTAPASSTGSTPPPVVFTTTESTTLVPTTPGVTTRKPTTTTHSTPLSTLPLTTPGSVSTAAVSTGVVPTVTATTLQSTPVSKPSSTIPTTGTTAQTPPGLLTTTTTLAPLVTTTPGSTTTGCQPKCQWTSWFSFHTPSSDPGDGDREDIKSIQASGGTICDHPQKVECRGVDYKELSASELGQNMICDINTGLLCENAKQKGKYKICYDYEMRALCCDYKHCETTPAPLVTTSATTTEAPGSTVGKSTAPASSTGSTPPPVVPTTTESTTLVSTTPGETTGKPTTTETPGSTAGKSTAPASSTGSTPPPVVFTTTESTTLVPTTPGVTTRKPTTTTHSTPLSTLPLTTPGSVSTAAVSTGVVPTVTATTLQSTPVSKPSSTIPTTGTTAQTPPGLLTTTTTLAPLVTTTPGSTTTGCQPKCQWTSWFSFHTPSSDPGDGDREDIKSIQASGGTICDHPQKVECRGVDYKELSASELGQNMICDINTGLLCENAKQKGKYKICYDYEMRALCCDYKHCETTPAPLVTTSATTTEAPGSTVGKSTAPASSTGSTPPPVVPTTTESTTLVSTTPGETTGKPTTTETPGSTAGKSTAPASSTGSTPPPVVFTTTESTTLVPTTPGVTTRKPTTTTHSTPLSTLPLTTPGSVSTAAVSTGVVPTVTATTLQSTPVSKPSSTIPTTGTTAQTPPGLLTTTTTLAPLVTTTPGSTTTGCQPKCQWTSWFSFHTPSSDPGDGDREDIKSIQASGGTICDHPQKVECRGVDYKELSASELGQNMICDINTGLLCENAKQKGKYKICYDYEMRALCCDYKHCETTPAPLVTTSATTTEAPGSTVGKSTAPASSTGSTPPPVVPTTTESTTLVSTTPGETTGKPTTTETPGSTAGKSTAPASSTGSTPPPVVFTTTESTTLVPTTPGVTTRKPTTTTHSTPLSTLPLTTPGSVSTAAVSTGVVPTVTATTLQSTPVSKPSSTIPTTGTTAQTPPGLLTTTTTLAPLVTTTPGSTTTGCQPKCQWTSWFSFHTPSSDPGDGDREDIKSIQASGGTICDHPQKVECRGVDYKELSASELGQNMICDINTGLLCENAKQKGKYKICYDYEMRALCCDYKHCETTPAPLVTTSATTTEAPGSTVGKSTAPVSSTGSTPPPVVPTTTESTTLVSTTPGETTGKPTTTETPGSTAGKSTAPASSTGSTPPPVVHTTTESTTLVPTTPGVTTRKPTTTTHSTPLSTLPLTTPGSVSTAAVSTGVVPTVTATTLQSTPVSKPSSTIPTAGTTAQTPPGLLTTTTTLAPLVTTTLESTSTVCLPKCNWTSWYDLHRPTSSPDDGDIENFETIRKAGGNICKHPQDIECRAENHPDVSLYLLGQEVQCNLHVGLLCENSKQTDKMCYNFQVRYQCCEYKPCHPSTTPLSTPAASTTEKPGSTAGKSTTPASSTGSTPPPIVFTTTQSSTLVSTTPGVTTGKPTTTETPGSTAGKSTAPASSTGSTPPPIVFTTTESTTLVSTTPGVTTGKPTTTETPGSTAGKSTAPASSTASTPPPIVVTTTQSTTLLSTTPGITTGNPMTTIPFSTPGSVSTPSITSGVASTVSTTSLPSTHVSIPVSTISTTGITVETATVPTRVPFSTKPLVVVTTAATSTSIPSTTGTTTVTLSRTTPCFCRVPGFSKGLFSPGEVIYNRTDSSGCSFYAVCNRSCEIEVFQGPCPSTTPSHPSTPSVTTAGTQPSPSPTTVVPSTRVYTTAAVSTPTTPVTGCPDIDPPRKTNETWMFNNCTVATCEGNNKIVLKPQPPVEKTVCVSGLPPIKIVDKDGCVERYECECICTGWDANYLTFDGTYYTFYDNCTYILVKEIVNIHGNLSVLLDNYFCDVTNNQPCSRAIIVNYNSMEVVLSSEVHEGVRINKIFFNHEPVNGDFTKYGISVTSTGTVMSVEIPALQAFISFNGLTFSIKLPFDLFQHNTEGQCGVCSNDKTDDCRLPNGHEASSCSEMASYWKTYDKNKPHCYGVPTTSPPTTTPHEPRTTTPAPTPCTTPSPLCELIVSDVFEECHKVLPPRIYYEDCLLEACQSSNDSVPCYNLEIYASLCIAKGVCTDWRNMTLGKCPYHCPKDKVYNACGPIHPVTCDDGPTKDTSEHVAEGCFCPEDKILFNTYTDICVKTCGCVGPDGLPKPPGSSWKSNCQECICDPLTESVQCKPQTCVSSEPPKCEKEGFVPVPVLTPKDPCCPELQCKCNTTTCSNEKKPCELGYEATPVLLEGDCCVSFPCIPIPDVCLVNGTLYRVLEQSSGKFRLKKILACHPHWPLGMLTGAGGSWSPTPRGPRLAPPCLNHAMICMCKSSLTAVLLSWLHHPQSSHFSSQTSAYKAEMPVPSKPCETCVCSSEKDPDSNTNLVKCQPVTCDKDCQEGYEYQVEAGECCGKCVQNACIINMNETTEILQPGDIWPPGGNNCSYYECEQMNDTFILVQSKRKCPIIHPEECESHELELTPDGCCETCKPKTNDCKVHKNQTLIRQSECISSEVVELTYCEGACPSSSKYSSEANAMQRECTCCQELKSHRRKVTLTCQDGRSIDYDYIYVDECQCMTACIPQSKI
ncbi:mucin-5B-like [Podarcis raffonei]|uniref:mucin-5B-like n=1 Tax=Podarcis raffonei TaxID=65483 RepID=UPI00232935C0|nr:mucin-5B-like [Podarcis raffonei]